MTVTGTQLRIFDPYLIKWQAKACRDFDLEYDWDLGVHEIMFSGAVGSAKTALGVHLLVKHCLRNPTARVCLMRLEFTSLKDTIYQEVLDHIDDEENGLIRGKHFWENKSLLKIRFANGSEIISRTLFDKRFKKARSLKLSALVIEEATEITEEFKEGFFEFKARIGRITSVNENFIMFMTNPDDPDEHWLHEYMIERAYTDPLKHVYYSVTTDNPFLPKWYVPNLLKDLDPVMVQRLIYGQWVAGTSKGRVYYAYKKENNFIDAEYEIDTKWPIFLSFDFNIGEGKPFSTCAAQYAKDQDTVHYFDEVVVESMRTEDALEEWASKGIFENQNEFIITGDQTGENRSTATQLSDFDVIKKFLSNFKRKDGTKLKFKISLPEKNPRLRVRHNKANAYCENGLGQHRIKVYKSAPTVDKGFRLTRLKAKGNYIEDDGPNCPWQHISTAATYLICQMEVATRTGQGGHLAPRYGGINANRSQGPVDALGRPKRDKTESRES